MSGAVCRRARPEDYQGVVAINESDYIVPMFHKYLKDPQTYSYVCEKKGEIVAYIFAQVVDNGKTLLTGAGRTKKGHESHGYQIQLFQFLIGDMAKEMSKYGTSYDMTGTSVYTPKSVEKTNLYGLPIMSWRGFMEIRFRTSEFIEKFKTMRPLQQNVDKLTHETAIATMLDPETRQRLFPANMILLFYQTYNVNKGNLKYILGLHGSTIYSMKKGGICTSLALVTFCEQKFDLRVDYEYYGDSLEEWRTMFLQCMRDVACLGYKGEVYFLLCYSAHLDGAKIRQMIKHLCGWDPVRDGYAVVVKAARIKNIVEVPKL